MKKFIAGFLSGAIIFSVVGVFAVNSIYDNPYKITVNGAEKYIQGYNIDDYSYFKLRDIADAVGGFSVGFDEQNQTIVLSTNEDIASPAAPIEPAPATNPADTSSSDIDNLPLGTIPEPMYVPSYEGSYSMVTNDEFKLPLDMNSNKEFGVILSAVADKANEIVGEKRFSEGLNDIYDFSIRETIITIDDTATPISGTCSLEYYYSYIVPWLQSLKQAQN